MHVYVISPVRRATKRIVDECLRYVAKLLQQGHTPYWPYLHTNQAQHMAGIFADNRAAMLKADRYDVFYDPASQGIAFDLGVAWQIGRPIYVAKVYDRAAGDLWEMLLDTAVNGKTFFGERNVNGEPCPPEYIDDVTRGLRELQQTIGGIRTDREPAKPPVEHHFRNIPHDLEEPDGGGQNPC